MYTPDSREPRPHVIVGITDQQPAEGLLTGYEDDGTERRVYFGYAFPDESQARPMLAVELMLRAADAAAVCMNGVAKVADRVRSSIRRAEYSRAGEPTRLAAGSSSNSHVGRTPLPPPRVDPAASPARAADHDTDRSGTHAHPPESLRGQHQVADPRLWESMWGAAMKGLRTAPPRTLLAAVKLPEPKRGVPSAPPRAEWHYETPAERQAGEDAARVDARQWEAQWRGWNGQWEEGIRFGTHTFDDILAYQRWSTQGQTIETVDPKALIAGAKRIFLGAAALFKPTQQPEPTLEQMQERCLQTYQEEFNLLSSRRSYLTSEVIRIRALIDRELDIPVKKVEAAAKTNFATLIRAAIGVLSDGQERVQSARRAGPDELTKTDVANYLGCVTELDGFGDGTGIQAMALQAAMARAGTYASADQQEQLRHFLESRVAA